MKMQKIAALVATLAAVSTPVLAQGQATAKQPDASWLKWDAATTTATFQLIGGAPGGKSPFNFNGFTDGELVLTVPENSTVVMQFVNEDGVPHSAEIIDGKRPMPNMSEGPAIPRAYTRKALEGMNQGEKDDMRFKAAPAGEYRIFCGVPGHGLSGMWIGFNVAAGIDKPTMTTKVAPPK